MTITVARTAQVIVDLSVLSLAYFIAFALRLEFDLKDHMVKLLFFTWPYVILFQYLVMSSFGVHRFAWRYIGLPEAQRILVAIGTATTVLVGLRLGLAPLGGYTRFVVIPLGVLGIDVVMAFVGITGVRVLRRILAERQERHSRQRVTPPVTRLTLLIGAGRAGVMVAKEVGQNPDLGIRIVGFVDDDVTKVGTVIQGVKILGGTDDLATIAEATGAEQAVISIAAAPGA
ncbi:MAG: hypothetical protein QGH45_11635, partial [Myxococcota bacterium]|nr:hypothetical protein [Myxococcota bacterium]